MSDQRPSINRDARQNRLPLPSHLVAILLMVSGAVGFAATLLIWGDRVLFLLASTLVTFIGLGFVIAGRRLARDKQDHGELLDSVEEESQDHQPDDNIQKVEPSLNTVTNGEDEDLDRPMIQRVMPLRRPLPTPPADPLGLRRDHIMGEPPVIKPNLLNQVSESLKSSGAQVTIENQRAGRAILQFSGSDGLVYSALVHDSLKPIDISELRSLQAMMNSRSSAGGFLFSSAPFSAQAYEWAGSRKIRLVMADELDEISF